MQTRYAQCESCGCEYPVSHMRRLVWALVCLGCEKKLSGVIDRQELLLTGEQVPAEPGQGALQFALKTGAASLSVGRHLVPFLAYLVIGLISRFGGEDLASLAAGALAADFLAWCLFTLIRAPFEGLRFGIDLMVRLVALILAQGPGLPWLATASRLDLGAISFFSVIVLRMVWFTCWWNDLLDDDTGGGDFEHSLPHGRDPEVGQQ